MVLAQFLAPMALDQFLVLMVLVQYPVITPLILTLPAIMELKPAQRKVLL